ncbi:MAG: TonB family protein [Burkholderiales bacterium]|nr:TonB family protein [Burkholderiales bacterium]
MLHHFKAVWPGPILLIAGALALGACSKSEPPPKPKSEPALPVTATQPSAEPEIPLAPRKSVDYMAGLKNFKDESKAVTREELERSAKQVVQSAEASKAAAQAKTEPAKPAETKAPAPAPAPVVQTPPPAPVAAPRSAPAEDVVAKAAPTAAAPAPTTTVTPVSRAAPDFPREAVRSGVDAGNVRARLTIDASGNVTNVQIVEARPARVFDRSVRETLSKWKFNSGADGRTYDTEVEFKR